MRISDWSSDVCSSDLACGSAARAALQLHLQLGVQQFPAGSGAGVLEPGPVVPVARMSCRCVGGGLGRGARDLLLPRLRLRHLRRAAGSVGVRPMVACARADCRSEEHTSELQSLMRISYAVFCLKKKNTITTPSKS